MEIQILEEPMTAAAQLATVAIAFQVESVFDVFVAEGGWSLNERKFDTPYVKDYDLDGDAPTRWAERFDVSMWGLLGAFSDGIRIGGAAVARFPERGEDLAVLWDIRVDYAARGLGVGSALFRAAEAWALSRGCSQLMVETQNINIPACRFYERQGCVLGAVKHDAYPEFPDEVQLLWYKPLS